VAASPDPVAAAVGGPPAGDVVAGPAGTSPGAGTGAGTSSVPAARSRPLTPTSAGVSTALADDPAAGATSAPGAEGAAATEDRPVDDSDELHVPATIAFAVFLCVAVTVVFGIIPGPLTDFVHKSTLLIGP
jgi:hypothetical protein